MSKLEVKRLIEFILDSKEDAKVSYDLAAEGKELDEMLFRRGELSGLDKALQLIAKVTNMS